MRIWCDLCRIRFADGVLREGLQRNEKWYCCKTCYIESLYEGECFEGDLVKI